MEELPVEAGAETWVEVVFACEVLEVELICPLKVPGRKLGLDGLGRRLEAEALELCDGSQYHRTS